MERISLLSNLIRRNFASCTKLLCICCWWKMSLIIWENFKWISFCKVSRIVKFIWSICKERNICTAKRKILSKSLWGQILLIRPAPLPRLNLFKVTQFLIIGWLDWPLSSRLNKIKLWDSSHHVSPWRRTKNYYRLSDKLVNLTPFALEWSPHI